jgi:REP element-mobilizing transposase RayT
MDPYIPLLENQYYHIYNRGNNRENIFCKEKNYNYFLKKYDYYLSEYTHTFAYCLLPNHFHLLVRVKPYLDFPLQTTPRKHLENEYRVSEQFRLLFMSYAKAINIQENRVGSLFQKNFKRKNVNNERYFSNLVYYIHANPQLHGICEDFREYVYSSYERILTDRPSKLFKDEVLKWFGSREAYIAFHRGGHNINEGRDFLIED